MSEIIPVDLAALEAFRHPLPPMYWFETYDDDVFEWDIVKAYYLAVRAGRQPEMVDVISWSHHLNDSIVTDEIFALSEKTDLNKPIIIVKYEDNQGQIASKIIDGTHRLYKALKTKVAELPAYILTVEEGKLCRTLK